MARLRQVAMARRALPVRSRDASSATVTSRLDIPVLRPGASPARLRRDRLPVPLHLARSLLGYAPLRPAERLRAGQYLAVSLSAASRQVQQKAADVLAGVLPALVDLLPAAGRARVVDAWVTRERTATFRAAPGSAALRPPARTGVPGVALAGAWTATGWPATMEGAVRSGQAAAAALLHGPGSGPVPAAPVAAGAPADGSAGGVW